MKPTAVMHGTRASEAGSGSFVGHWNRTSKSEPKATYSVMQKEFRNWNYYTLGQFAISFPVFMNHPV